MTTLSSFFSLFVLHLSTQAVFAALYFGFVRKRPFRAIKAAEEALRDPEFIRFLLIANVLPYNAAMLAAQHTLGFTYRAGTHAQLIPVVLTTYLAMYLLAPRAAPDGPPVP